MTKTETKSTVLIRHHLKALKLPTMHGECEKVAARAARENILLVGASGTGRTHLATALGVAACGAGRKPETLTLFSRCLVWRSTEDVVAVWR